MGDIFAGFELYSGLDGLYSMFANEALLLILVTFFGYKFICWGVDCRDSKKYFIPKIVIIPSLILTYFTGPVGLIIYWFIRIFFAKKLALMIKPFDFYFDFVSHIHFLLIKK